MPRDIRGTRVLLIDNYSSFSQNLVHYLAEITGVLPTVVANDHARPVAYDSFDAIVISPGPGSPEQERDFGICAEALAQTQVPVLGICLGHQGLGVVAGATLTLADEPYHGRSSRIVHQGDALFADVPETFLATRYHSLIVRDPLPPTLQCIARTSDGLIMGLRHRSRPQWSVQFHPESIASEYGHALLANFCRLARGHEGGTAVAQTVAQTATTPHPAPVPPVDSARRWRVVHRDLAATPAPAALFETLYAESESAFWLDGAATQSYSYMGDASGPHGYRLSYDLPARRLTWSLGREGTEECSSVLQFLGGVLAENALVGEGPLGLSFCGGLVGYFGYELKGELGAQNGHRSPWPDAEWLWVDRFIAYDHQRNKTTLVALVPDGESAAAATTWMRETEARLQDVRPRREASWPRPQLHWREGRERYGRLIKSCLEKITEGESYELCLTTQLSGEARVDGLTLFHRMRESNPAPYASYLRCGGFEIASASPERFLRIDASGLVESKPIKGTARRDPDPDCDQALAQSLRTSEKERAENLMIVDLVRHDLGHTCAVGTVEVTALAEIESYASVHQLVSTVRGQLRSDATALQCVAAAFPGGSMTGAPKKRSMEILDELESGPRGPYSGSIGYLSLTGAVDLSIVIRSVIVDPQRVHIGVGGAITALSDPDSEQGEVRLKARAQREALG